jgi:ribosomal protein L12E/L44/L45/RPP1/RPP2
MTGVSHLGVLQLAILIGIAAPATRAQAQWWPNKEPVDYEDCIAKGETKAATQDTKAALQTQCDAKFAGRRKPGGGYTYFDFMQNRSFDIAGPNPTAAELRKIDEEYTAFLDERRRQMIVAAFTAKQQQIAALQQQATAAEPPPPLPKPRVVADKPRAAVDKTRPRAEKKRAERKRATEPQRYACGSNDPLSCGLTQLSAGFSAVKTSLFGTSTTTTAQRR